MAFGGVVPSSSNFHTPPFLSRGSARHHKPARGSISRLAICYHLCTFCFLKTRPSEIRHCESLLQPSILRTLRPQQDTYLAWL
ncbi:uncharacterized protein QC761_0003260 [Podospora bellae-mahoneyi]|uniref:Uncharacterized protein n=1 Tax=Podospora bellae-mahoneyi TaxID=2093777 RepID=A0ABR0FUP3_9PEZI|nr:hypothetical protein QC761_0003260 [Podospora bellae-mahoneyi]